MEGDCSHYPADNVNPGQSEKEADEIIDRIENSCTSKCLQNIPASISMGYAVKTSEDEKLRYLMYEAEKMMYAKKLEESKEIRRSIIGYLEGSLYEKGILTQEGTQKILELAQSFGQGLELDRNDQEKLKLLARLYGIGKVFLANIVWYCR